MRESSLQYRYLKSQMVVVFICFLFIFLQFNITISGSSTESIIYVDDDNISGPWDGTQDYPYQYIQDGIDAANDGDTVFVFNGIYNGQIIVDKSIMLEGENKNTTIIDGQINSDIIRIISNGTVIHDLTITNRVSGIYADQVGISIVSKNNLIYDNILIDNECGLYVQVLNSNITIINNVFNNNTAAIKLRFTSDTLIMNNTLDNNYACISMTFADHITIYGNTILTRGGISVIDSYNCNITKNYVSTNGTNIRLESSEANMISKNYFKGYIGVFFTEISNNNWICNNTFTNHKWGLKLFWGSSNNIINGNMIVNSTEHGVFFNSGSCNGNIFSNNTIMNSSTCGIYFNSACADNQFYHNNFIDNYVHANVRGSNLWDDGRYGNYWDDYEEQYPDARKTLRSIWNTPYELNEENIDCFPLVNEYSGSMSNSIYGFFIQLIKTLMI